MFEANHATIAAAERAAADGSVDAVLDRLRALSIADFGELMWALPLAGLPHISRLLPRMASPEAQLGWTGKAGHELLLHTVDFCRILGLHYHAIAGRPLAGEAILDFGFGYGRIARILYWFSNPDRYCGVDPMQSSLDACAADGVLGRFRKIDYLPRAIEPFGLRFGLLFAYSVFTHTSRNATLTGLRNLRALATGRGVLAITIRPVEHWRQDTGIPETEREALMAEHRRVGFAFRPHAFVDPSGERVYGENSMTEAWIEANAPEWTIVARDRGLDPFQTILFLVPS